MYSRLGKGLEGTPSLSFVLNIFCFFSLLQEITLHQNNISYACTLYRPCRYPTT